MKVMLRNGVIAAAMLGTASFAFGQGVVVDLSPEQRTTVYQTITKERVRTAPPAGISFSVGAEIPANVELYAVPETVEVPAVRRYRYTVWNNQVVLVDPGTRKVVQIIRD
jgi:hypothetical protein